jgi:hypothetical protein
LSPGLLSLREAIGSALVELDGILARREATGRELVHQALATSELRFS